MIEHQIKEMEDLEERAEYEAKKFDYDPMLTTDQLEGFTLRQYEYIVYSIHGMGATRNYGTLRCQVSIFSRDYTYGDVSYGVFSDTQYMGVLRDYLTKHACTYCKQIAHTKLKCPKLLAMKCSACQQQGHLLRKCRDVDALRRYAASKDTSAGSRDK